MINGYFSAKNNSNVDSHAAGGEFTLPAEIKHLIHKKSKLMFYTYITQLSHSILGLSFLGVRSSDWGYPSWGSVPVGTLLRYAP